MDAPKDVLHFLAWAFFYYTCKGDLYNNVFAIKKKGGGGGEGNSLQPEFIAYKITSQQEAWLQSK